MPIAFSTPVLLALAAGYILGSIPFGLVLTKLAGLGDIRSVGSGNIGATNVLRTGHKGLAAATLLLDGVKGTVAVLLGGMIMTYLAHRAGGVGATGGTEALGRGGGLLLPAFAGGFGAFLGHIYPVWLGFKGGKGVATFIGVLAGLYWPAAIIFCAVWLATAIATKYSSLSALVASVAAPIGIWLMGLAEIAVLLVPMSALLIYKHRSNIERLKSGQEPKIGAKA